MVGIRRKASSRNSRPREWNRSVCSRMRAARISVNCGSTRRCSPAPRLAKHHGDYACCTAIPSRAPSRRSKKNSIPRRWRHSCNSAARGSRDGCGNCRHIGNVVTNASRTSRFRFPTFRTAQRALSAEVYRTVRDGGALLFEAPTGSGKTLSALFPSLIAMGQGSTDRLVFLSSKTTGQAAAEAAFKLLDVDDAVRRVTVTAKAKICFMPEPVCDPAICAMRAATTIAATPPSRSCLRSAR